MTAGALYQIKNLNKNSANNFLELNPQISFFKIVYRKYSRFALENISFNNLSRNTLDFDESVTIKSDIPRNGDLLKSLYFTFTLPDIYSGKLTTDNISENYRFKWIENIGINIFNYVTLKINDQELDKLYSDYINIWKEQTLEDEEKEIFNENIGHVKELYDPANGLGQNGTYPHISSGTTNTLQAEKFNNKKVEIVGSQIVFKHDNVLETTTSNYDDTIFPSIKGRKIKVPLPFSFTKNSGLALPLIALQYSVLSLEFNMRKFLELYTVIDAKYSASSNSFGKRVKPNLNSEFGIENFTNNYAFNIRPNIEGEYIFLDDEERKRFAIHDHEYLYEQVKTMDKDGVEIRTNLEETNAKILSAFNPVKYLTWVVKRDDFKHINQWNNYTNWVYPDCPPYSNQYMYKDLYYNLNSSTDIFYNYNNTTHKTYFNKTDLKKHILTNVRIEFDGNVRINKDGEYFLNQQPYEYFKKRGADGNYIYSFSLNPTDYQPSGVCNFSDISNPRIYFKKELHSDGFSEHNYRAYVYIVSYNILVVKNGVGSLKFVN